jgi:SAM-dependent methyltransferase
MGDVLEHVEEEQALLEAIDASLRPGGTLLLTVPAYDWLWSGEDIVSEHKRRYTLPTLNAALQRAGFAAVKGSYFNSLLLPVVAAVIWGEKLLSPRREPRSDLRPLPGWINEPLRWVFSLEESILRRTTLPFGASILMVAARATDARIAHAAS